jgi:hypothetical protein
MYNIDISVLGVLGASLGKDCDCWLWGGCVWVGAPKQCDMSRSGLRMGSMRYVTRSMMYIWLFFAE